MRKNGSEKKSTTRIFSRTRVLFVNNGEVAHTITARDGSWSTGPLAPATSVYVTLEDAGTLLYHCTDHPWAIGQLTVEERP